MDGRSTATCALVARRSPRLADRMWGSVTLDDGREWVDRTARRQGRRLCDSCPLRTACLSDALAGQWKDARIAGGLTYRERRVLARIHPARIRAWLRDHPQAVGDCRDTVRAYWRRTKKASSMRRTGAWPTDAKLVQGTLF